MKLKAVRAGFMLGILTSIPLMLLSWFSVKAGGMPFLPFTVFDSIVRVLPGFVVNPLIHLIAGILMTFYAGSLSNAAKLAEQVVAIIQFFFLGGVFGGMIAVAAVIRKGFVLPLTGAVLGLAAFFMARWMMIVVGFPKAGPYNSVCWLGFVLITWGTLLGLALRESLSPSAETGLSPIPRRYITVTIAILSAIIGLALFFVSLWQPALPTAALSPQTTLTAGLPGPSPQQFQSRIAPAPGTRPEITAQKDFYRIDIDTLPPKINPETWQLEITGLVEHPLRMTLKDIRALPAVSQYATMSCISNPVGGPLISTGLWTGVPLMTVLNLAGLDSTVNRIVVRAVDGYYETVINQDMKDPRTLLVYEINGEPLTPDQGFPLRLFIPNRYGMKQPKWINRIQAIPNDGTGYWVDRGWDEAAIVQTTSVIDVVAVGHPDSVTGAIPMGGIAYAGDRGISRVEVQVDDSPWVQAILRTPPLSPLTWVQWRYDWTPVKGQHTVRVRAFDSNNVMQPPEIRDVFPMGATGYHSVRFRL